MRLCVSSAGQVEVLREAYGANTFPEMPMKGFCLLFAESFNDTILLVLIAAAVVSLIIGMIEHPEIVRKRPRLVQAKPDSVELVHSLCVC